MSTDLRQFPWPRSKPARYAVYAAVGLGWLVVPIILWFVMGLWF